MTIHSDHPFATPDNPVRRLRGRLSAPVTVVSTGVGRSRVGLTVSSVLVVEPDLIVFVINELADLTDAIELGSAVAITMLESGDDQLAEAFAGLAPAPGGMFTVGDWIDSAWGPRLARHSWVGARVIELRPVSWFTQVTVQIGEIELTEADVLAHVRGRYRT